MHILTTGATDKARVNNIYDMAGNVSELIMAGIEYNYRAYRGGVYYYTAKEYSIGKRGPNGDPGDADAIGGFRVAIYIKK